MRACCTFLSRDCATSWWQGKAKAGTVLYRIVWENYPPDLVWYEPAENVGCKLLEEYEQRVVAEAGEEEAEAREDAQLQQMEEEDTMPLV